MFLTKAEPLYMMARYYVSCANAFFRICRSSGIFLRGEERRMALKHGMDMNVARTSLVQISTIRIHITLGKAEYLGRLGVENFNNQPLTKQKQMGHLRVLHRHARKHTRNVQRWHIGSSGACISSDRSITLSATL